MIVPRSNYDRWLHEGGEELLHPYDGPMRSIRIAEPKIEQELKDSQGTLFP